MDEQSSRIRLFSVTFDQEQLDRLGCTCNIKDVAHWQVAARACRPCSITWGMYNSKMDATGCEVFDPDTGRWLFRRLTGTAVTDCQAFNLSRLLALAHDHDDPIVLMMEQGRVQQVIDMGVTVPPIIYLEYWRRQERQKVKSPWEAAGRPGWTGAHSLTKS